MLRACALVLLGCVLVASPALVSPAVACIWLLPCDTTGSGAVGRGLQPEDAVVVFARSCGSVCNKPPPHTVAQSRFPHKAQVGWTEPGRGQTLPWMAVTASDNTHEGA